jgi:hypothetical protein
LRKMIVCLLLLFDYVVKYLSVLDQTGRSLISDAVALLLLLRGPSHPPVR